MDIVVKSHDSPTETLPDPISVGPELETVGSSDKAAPNASTDESLKDRTPRIRIGIRPIFEGSTKHEASVTSGNLAETLPFYSLKRPVEFQSTDYFTNLVKTHSTTQGLPKKYLDNLGDKELESDDLWAPGNAFISQLKLFALLKNHLRLSLVHEYEKILKTSSVSNEQLDRVFALLKKHDECPVPIFPNSSSAPNMLKILSSEFRDSGDRGLVPSGFEETFLSVLTKARDQSHPQEVHLNSEADESSPQVRISTEDKPTKSVTDGRVEKNNHDTIVKELLAVPNPNYDERDFVLFPTAPTGRHIKWARAVRGVGVSGGSGKLEPKESSAEQLGPQPRVSSIVPTPRNPPSTWRDALFTMPSLMRPKNLRWPSLFPDVEAQERVEWVPSPPQRYTASPPPQTVPPEPPKPRFASIITKISTPMPLRAVFATPQAEETYFRERKVLEYKRAHGFSTRFFTALLGGLALIVPMLIMAIHENRMKSLITASVCVLLFALGLAWAVPATPQELLGTTAAYAAVLVVFVGVSS